MYLRDQQDRYSTYQTHMRGSLDNRTPNVSVAFSVQAKYTDWATATCWRNLVPTFADRGVSSGQRGGSPTLVKLSFLDRTIALPSIL
jgi:hypothetical protein